MNNKLRLAVLNIAILLTACGSSVEPTSQYPPCDIVQCDDGPAGGGPEEMMCTSPTGRYIAHIEFLAYPGGTYQGAIKEFTVLDTEEGTSAYHSDSLALEFFAWSPNEDYLILGFSHSSIAPVCWTGVVTADGATFVHDPNPVGYHALFEPLEFNDDKLLVYECNSHRCYAIDLSRLPEDFYVPGETEEVSCERFLQNR
jgi:hypothetical protein